MIPMLQIEIEPEFGDVLFREEVASLFAEWIEKPANHENMKALKIRLAQAYTRWHDRVQGDHC